MNPVENETRASSDALQCPECTHKPYKYWKALENHFIKDHSELAWTKDLFQGLVATAKKGSALAVIANRDLDDDIQAILDKLLFRIRSVMAASSNKYILLNAPNDKLQEIISLIPGMKSPTVLPLAEEGWSSVHSVLRESTFWEVIDRLKELGAQGILVIPIEKMIV